MADCVSYTKITLSILSALSLTIIVAAFSDKIPIGVIAASLICLYIVCGIVIFDNSSLIKILKIEADRLHNENGRLNQLNNTLSTNVDSLNVENGKYKTLNTQQASALAKFDNQLKDNKALIDANKKQMENLAQMLVKSEHINNMNNALIISQKDNIDKLNAQLGIATANNIELSNQVQKFETLNGGLKTIITTMARTLDQSSNLEAELTKSIDRVQEVSHDIQQSSAIMDKIINGLSHLKFDQLDIDNNGEISKSEWQKIVFLDTA
jgi:DNA repair exonuclease SbcCD ATPase subunit